jgi:ribosome-associated protein
MRDVAIGDDTIRLGQLMKLANVADSGGDAKSLLAAGEVRVNGEVETRRGRQLRRGDEVVLLGQHLRVVGKA